MKLIDAEALKRAIDDYAEKNTLHWLSDIEEIIDNAPTVHDTINLYPSGKVIIQQTKPQGEWIIDGHHRRCNYCNEYTCTEDREGNSIPNNFCPNCGAKMKGEI